MPNDPEDLAAEVVRLRRRVAELEAARPGTQAAPAVAGSDRLRHVEALLEDSQTCFRKVFDYSNDAILLIDPDRDEILDANPAACRLLGYTQGELCSLTIGAVFPRDMARLQAVALAVAEAGYGWIDEVGCQTRTGEGFAVEVSASEVPIDAQRSCQLLLLRNIAARKAADARLLASLHEKEILLREIHHRVKNNLQVVSSLFDLQAARTDDPDMQSMLRECRNRVRSMSAIHGALYRANDLARVDFRRYVTQLSDDLLRSFGAATRVALRIDIDDVVLDVDQAIPCGLIVNELVSNALKHAFPDADRGCVRLSMTVGDDVLLVVADDGRGLPADLDVAASPSLGLRLVHSLVGQLHGQIEMERAPGTTFRVRFPRKA